jgi:hypothetical protein
VNPTLRAAYLARCTDLKVMAVNRRPQLRLGFACTCMPERAIA